jgi:ABC-2 type transport system permease protein
MLSTVETKSPFDSVAVAPAGTSAIRPVYWSIRRDLWENRSIYIAPLLVNSVVMFGFLISLTTLPRRMRALGAADAMKQRAAVGMPFNMIAGLTVVTAFIVGAFYCLDALHGERSDRSILFWKSLPVSDRITVLSKASIPLVVLPLFLFALIVSAQLIMLVLSAMVLEGSGTGVAILAANVRFFQSAVALLYSLIAMALWHAPIYAWLLLVSAWARRATFLWAVLPAFAISILERIAFNTSHFAALIRYRLIGWFTQSFVLQPGSHAPMEPLAALTAGRFLSTPGLWLGLIAAAIFLAAAVRLRHYREPI